MPGLLNGPNGLAKLVETVLNQILEAQVAESVGALPAEKNEVWQERKYLGMDEFNDWAALKNTPVDDGNVIAMNG